MARWAYLVDAGVLVQPAGPVVARLAQLEDWALAQPADQDVARGVLAAVGWMAGVRPTGPISGRPCPTVPGHVVAELGRARCALRGRHGSTYAHAAGVAVVLTTASHDEASARVVFGELFGRVLRDWHDLIPVAVITDRPAA